MDAANDPSRSVSVKPGKMLLMVMHEGSSRLSDFAHEAIAPRRVLDNPILGIGSRTEVEMMFTILPIPASSMAGTTIRVIWWAA